MSKGYDQYLRHSINKKLSKFEEQILPTILSNETTRSWFIELIRKNTNTVRENTNNTLRGNKIDSALFQENKLIITSLIGFEPVAYSFGGCPEKPLTKKSIKDFEEWLSLTF